MASPSGSFFARFFQRGAVTGRSTTTTTSAPAVAQQTTATPQQQQQQSTLARNNDDASLPPIKIVLETNLEDERSAELRRRQELREEMWEMYGIMHDGWGEWYLVP